MFGVSSQVQDHVSQNSTWPIRLFKLGGNPVLYFTDSDAPVLWNGIVWAPKGVGYSKVEEKLGYEIDTFTVTVDNIDDSMIAWALNSDPTGQWAEARKGFCDGQVDGEGHLILVNDETALIFGGRITSLKVAEDMEFDVKSALDLYNQRALKVLQQVTCRFQGINGFKGPNCGYSGAETVCNYTAARCTALGNYARFGGYPDVTTKNDS
jgi:hypothetical protein